MPTRDERKQIDGIIDGLLDAVEGSAKGMARTLTITLAQDTPKATGFAAANWRPSRGRPERGKLPPRNAAGVANAREAQEQGLKEIERYELEDGDLHVVNDTPYINVLNDGHSKRAPRGFVQQAIQKTVREESRKR